MFRSMTTFGRLLMVAIVIGAMILAGNSLVSAEEGHDHGHGDHDAPATPAPVEQPRELIVVTVSEYAEDGFAIDIAPAGILNQLHAGQAYDVIIVNAGGIAHELMVMPSAMAHMGHDHMEHMGHESLLTINTDQLSHRGAVVEAELTFPEVGEYTLICHLHPGMETTVTVVS